MSNPQTTINLCSGVRLNNDYQHTIWFGSQTEQLNYFSSKVVKTLSNYTYVRKSWTLKVDATMEEARLWSYLYFRNGTGKYYFYFINNIEYINDNTVELFIEMDVMQTYFFSYSLKHCFVEREHSATDEIGDNLIDEGLELGEFVDISKQNIDMQDLCIVIIATRDLKKSTEESRLPSDGNIYDGVFSGLDIFACDMEHINSVKWLMVNYNDSDSENLLNMFMYPKNLVRVTDDNWDEGLCYVEGTKTINVMFSRPDTLKGNYIPKNNKLFTYPYNFLYITNNNGSSCNFKYEYFEYPSIIQLRLYGSITGEAGTRLVPISYKGSIINYDEGLMGATYPTCAWASDTYKLWLAQNQHSQNLGYLTSIGSIGVGAGLIVTGVGAGAGAGMVAGGILGITNQLAQNKDMSAQPHQSRGAQSGNINIGAEHHTYTVISKCVNEKRAKIIDDFFTMYGYKTLEVKRPNRKVRESFTYTKTQNCLVTGNLCTDDLRKIQSIYDNGVTFWVDGDSIGDYTISNKCL